MIQVQKAGVFVWVLVSVVVNHGCDYYLWDAECGAVNKDTFPSHHENYNVDIVVTAAKVICFTRSYVSLHP